MKLFRSDLGLMNPPCTKKFALSEQTSLCILLYYLRKRKNESALSARNFTGFRQLDLFFGDTYTGLVERPFEKGFTGRADS